VSVDQATKDQWARDLLTSASSEPMEYTGSGDTMMFIHRSDDGVFLYQTKICQELFLTNAEAAKLVGVSQPASVDAADVVFPPLTLPNVESWRDDMRSSEEPTPDTEGDDMYNFFFPKGGK